jgi:hypothetical protein
MKAAPFDAKYLRSILDYDPETGIFRWKHRPEKPLDWNTKYAGRVAGTRNAKGYIQIAVDRRIIGASRLAWLHVVGSWPQHEIDHINGRQRDNRFVNLREATRTQNGCNRGRARHNQSGFKGVSMNAGKTRFVAVISVAHRKIHLGTFDTAAEAHAAYVAAAPQYHGEFARAA